MPTPAEQLKAEGNALFGQQDFALAALKFTEAIELDEANAVLYSNRAACRLRMREYLDAVADAQKAVDLDPMYAKAWSRLATAEDCLRHPIRSVPAWRRALDSLPKTDLSPAEQQQKADWARRLRAAEAALANPADVLAHGAHVSRGEQPWAVAARLGREYARAGQAGPQGGDVVWLVNEAREEFQRALDGLNAQQQVRDPRSGQAMLGTQGGIVEALTNAIIADKRVIEVDAQWLQRSDMQVQWELNMSGGWRGAGADQLMREFPGRVSRDGWLRARIALVTTVRVWILRAFLEAGLRGEHKNARALVSGALQVLTWARDTYKSVPASDKGAVFEPSFILGVRAYLLELLMSEYQGTKDQETLEEYYEEAQETSKEVESLPPPSDPVPSPAHRLQLYVYPKAAAAAALGFYHATLANMRETSHDDAAEHLNKSSAHYLDAATALPADDEAHPFHVATALQHMRPFPVPVSATLSILAIATRSIPRAEPIWRASALWRGGAGQRFAKLLEIERELKEGLTAGKWTPDTSVRDTGVQVP